MATATVNAPESQSEVFSLDSAPWLEKLWEDSGLPAPVWRRLRGIDAAAHAAASIAEILAIDRQNRELSEDINAQYVPLPARHTASLGDALVVLMDDVREGLEELRDFSPRYDVVIEERHH